VHMKKIILAAIVVSMGYLQMAQAEETNKVSQMGEKVKAHIAKEVQATKEYQAKSWAEIRYKWQGFKEKFLSN